FCIPYITIEPVISKLSGQYWYSSVRKGTTTEYLAIIKERLETVIVDLIVEIGKIDIKIKDVLALRLNDCIKLDVKTKDNFIANIGNRSKFECRPGTVGSKMAIQIVKVLSSKEIQDFEDIEEGGEE
ncbi:MAG TPA: FliM/FliN family flagellar motor switch protein, partial [Spirochaetota bacterium]|nr:FliM/FliN family flagellar motor switch protein [Spirochaetota bacterium]